VAGIPAVELSWSPASAEGCIDQVTLAARVEQVVGRRVFSAHASPESIIQGRVVPGRDGRGWLAVIEARSEGTVTSRRELALAASDCRQLDEAIVLVVALMVDSSEEQQAPLALPPPAARPSVAIGADLVITYGMLPGTTLGFGLVSDFALPPLWPLALSTHVWPATDARQEGSGGALGAWTVGAEICPPMLARRDWAFCGCAGGAGGAVSAIGVGLDVSRSNTRPYVQADVRVGLRLRVVGPLFAAVDVEGAVPFTRDRYSYVQADGTVHDVFQTAPVIALGHARLEIRVP
jgi:hypothetical protein